MSAESPSAEINAITFHCSDMERSLAFYLLLGGEVVHGGPNASFSTIRLDGTENFVNLQQRDGFAQPSGGWGRIILHVVDPDSIHRRALEAGLHPEMAPSDAPWGERYFHLRDPDGNEISLAKRLAAGPASVAPTSSGHRVEALIRRYFACCNAADRQGLIDCFTPDAVHYFPPGLPGAPWRSAEAIADGWVWCVANLGSRWTIEKVLVGADGREAVIEWTHWKTALGEVLRGDEWYRFDEDLERICEIRAYYASPVDKLVTVNELHEFDYESRGFHVQPPVDPFLDPMVPETTAVRPGEVLDWAKIEAFLREHLPAEVSTAGQFAVEQFPNGAANLTYLVSFGQAGATTSELVLRRPPFGAIAPGAHDMKREFKVLSRLWRHFEKAPRAYLLCDDPEVAGADFFVMERRRGSVVRGVIPEALRAHERVGERLGLALVKTVADFHLLDPATCGLVDLGKPTGFVERQVEGWQRRWGLVADPAHDALMTKVHARLSSSLPTPQRVSLVHNDLKLDNCMFADDDPDRVVAIFDWDMTTVGDPLIDLGTLLNYWPDPGDPVDVRRSSHDGMTRMGLPSRAVMAATYGKRTGLDVSRIAWYEAFAQWKTAVVVQQLHHRWKVGDSSDERMATIADTLPALVASAAMLLDGLDRG